MTVPSRRGRIPTAVALTLALAASAGCGSGPGGTEPNGAVASQGGEAPDGASRVPFVTFEGTFPAVPVVLDGSVEGWFTLDTSGLFPVALAPAPHAPSDDVRVTELQSARFGQVRIDGVPAVTGLVPADLAELAGAPIAGMRGAALTHRLRMTLDPQARALRIDRATGRAA